ncbi:transmembrane and coiled-coil domains protein 1-like [Paramacrobiotus metropolitanus]|uniref:transmembrane and coiled-coil domains protein 1-like n=1 Tax=Paramacrobiotus metropolitanus TaxID=2943436 RepID=UPI002445BC28|nr:transmembrane and coiled-coil domains protein 1-like [Paramacrobiotus metropolitanus]
MASRVSSVNDLLDGGGSTVSSSKPTDYATVQKKLTKIEQCIADEEHRLQTIQDDLIKLGIAPHNDRLRAQMRRLEEANDKASRHLEQYKVKKRKYESLLLRMAEEKTREAAHRAASPQVVKTGSGGRILDALMRRERHNGESGGSARSKDSRGSQGDSAGVVGEGQALSVPGVVGGRGSEGVSVSSVESDSMESQRRMKRVEEIAEVVDQRLEPLRGDVGELKEKLEQILKLIEEKKSEWAEERKSTGNQMDDMSRRCGYVEEQIHDLIELHQKETSETKTYLVDTQDKMNYIFHEKIRDMKDEITLLNTRIQKIEHRQKEDEALARTEAAKSVMGEMAFKLVDCLLLLGQLVIAVVGAVTQFFQMTAENSTRLVIFLVAIIAILVLWQLRGELPFNQEIGRWLVSLRRPLRRMVFRLSGGWLGDALNDTSVL